MELAVFALLLALLENIRPASAELQSLLIFTTATADDREIEELRGKWSKLGTFESAFSGLINADIDQQNFWTILLSRGEPDVLFGDIEKAIQADDRTKVIVGKPNGIIDRIFLSPFCWRRGATEQMAFVMCNGKLEFPIDDRGWEIDEKVEVNGAMRRGEGSSGEDVPELIRRSVWIDLLPGVRMATASPLQKRSEAATNQHVEKAKLGKKGSKKHGKEKPKEEEIEINGKKVDEEEEDDDKEEKSKVKAEEVRDEDKNNSDEDEDENDVEEEEENEMVKREDTKMDNEKEKKIKENDREEESDGDEDENDDENEFNELNEAEKKRQCRYRLSCYAKNGIELSEKQWEKHQHVLSGKLAPPKGEKSTMKNAANEMLKKMKAKEAEGKVKREQYAKDGERVLADFWTELEHKNRCKYRKSCYRTGKVPPIERNAFFEWLGGGGKEIKRKEEDNDDEEIVKKFEEMNDYEQKLHCRYRRSCYPKGIRSPIDNGLGFLRFGADDVQRVVKNWWWELEQKKIEKKEKEKVEGHEDDEKSFSKLGCKYRKSCYASGELPEHLKGPPRKDPEEEHAAKVLGGKKVPTSIKELKLFCKYRKSCYVASAAAAEKSLLEPRGGDKEESPESAHHNETAAKIEMVGELPRKPKPNSDSHAKTVIVPVPNGGEDEKDGEEEEEEKEKKTTSKNTKKERVERLVENQKKKEEQIERAPTPSIVVPIKKRKMVPAGRRVPANEEKPVVEHRKERKHKRYTVLDEVHVETGPIIEEKVEEPIKEKVVAVMDKEKYIERKTKRYPVEEVPKDESLIKVWAKRSYKDDDDNDDDEEEELDVSSPEEREKKEDVVSERKDNQNERSIDGWERMGDKERWFRCKYRKSCYERNSRAAGIDPKMESKMKVKEGKEKVGEGKRKKPKAPAPPPPPQFVDMATKLQCKYRKSCYSSGDLPKVMDRVVAEEAGQRNWTGEGRCNPWRISCRQAMGLPIREKAPIGPNGKRLCRKRKSTNDASGNDGKK